MNLPNGWLLAAACALGLLLTLVLAAWLTPRRWWRRPTAANLALAGGGALAFAFLFVTLRPAEAPRAAGSLAAEVGPALRYRVIEDLNLRAARATGAPRLAVLPAGTLVTPVGMGGPAHGGDWLRVRATVKGRAVEGWTSSLWLRRVDER